jgi:hypothetical protein
MHDSISWRIYKHICSLCFVSIRALAFVINYEKCIHLLTCIIKLGIFFQACWPVSFVLIIMSDIAVGDEMKLPSHLICDYWPAHCSETWLMPGVHLLTHQIQPYYHCTIVFYKCLAQSIFGCCCEPLCHFPIGRLLRRQDCILCYLLIQCNVTCTVFCVQR